MGENDDEEDDDDDDEGNIIAPPAPAPAPAPVPEEIIEEEALVEMIPKQEASVVHEVILADAEPEPPQPRLFNMIRRDYECGRTPLKKQGFVSQDPTRGFSMKQKCVNTHISI
jgi:hypothetical protein